MTTPTDFSESPPTDGGEEAHERGHLLGLGDASESPPTPSPLMSALVNLIDSRIARSEDVDQLATWVDAALFDTPHWRNDVVDRLTFARILASKIAALARVGDASESGQPPEASDE